MGYRWMACKPKRKRARGRPALGLAVCLALLAGGTAYFQTTERLSVATAGTEGNGTSGFSAIAAAGRYIAFQSDVSNLSPGDTDGYYDIFLRDREAGTTKRVSAASDGSKSTAGIEGNRGSAISGDARYIGFYSDAPDLAPSVVVKRQWNRPQGPLQSWTIEWRTSDIARRLPEKPKTEVVSCR